MAVIDPGDDPGAGNLDVRAPRQRRTREQWDRILDAGVALLEEGGYEAFTIAALCERAEVPPRALYARADSKDALFLAVYEHGMQRVLASEQVLDEREPWDAPVDQRLERSVRGLVDVFADNAEFLRAVVLISGAHPEVRRRGEVYRQAVSRRFTASLGRPAPTSASAREREFCFDLVFSAMVVRVAYGLGFGPAGDLDELASELVTVAQRYLRVDRSPASLATRPG